MWGAAFASSFDVPAGDMDSALRRYMSQSGVQLLIPDELVKGIRTGGVKGEMAPDAALNRLLRGTGLISHCQDGAVVILRGEQSERVEIPRMELAQASPSRAGVETVTVTSSKLGGADVQSIPISITALSQEQLTATQTAGGPDLVKQVPNLTFSKTNFTGYNIQIRGIGTQAISVTTDPAVAVAMNDTPFLRNHFFEQEFYDLSQVEVLRGPQGTLYGRNATAGVVNVVTARPTDQFEAMASADLGNYHNRRFEGMINLPIIDDRLDLRIAGEWTKRDGYSFNELTDQSIDGRDLWSGRMTLGWKPVSNVQSYVIWEHFQENDNRLRSGKQLCQTDYGPGSIDGHLKPMGYVAANGGYAPYGGPGDFFTQGCKGGSLYSPSAFEAPLGYALPYVLGATDLGTTLPINPYASVTQSTNLRVIESSINPKYQAKNDTVEWNTDWQIDSALTASSATGYNNDFLWSAEDFNRFGATPGFFNASATHDGIVPNPSGLEICAGNDCGAGVMLGQPCTTGNSCELSGYFCDPQLGCSDRLVAEDLSTERAWQLSQEFRLTSNFSGPLNFSAGANYLHYETVEKYYVFSNALTLISCGFVPGEYNSNNGCGPLPLGFRYNVPGQDLRPDRGYVDPNPLSSLNDEGHNYFLSKNPYVLNSYAVFGETNYQIFNDLKLIVGLRWTDDQKHFLEIPSWVATEGYGYPVTGALNQQWDQWTGRAVVNWTPKLDFTDQTLIYGSAAHGYKAGGANPPGAQFTAKDYINGVSTSADPVHPLTFKPEFIQAFELGTKNTLLDGALTFNGDVFYYNYTGYQISEIVDRTAINTNYNAHVEGAEIETSWEPAPGFKLGFTGGFENSSIAKGTGAVDLMDRTAGHPGWYVVKPFATEASNCVFPTYVAEWIDFGSPAVGGQSVSYCSYAYKFHLDPFTQLQYRASPPVGADGEIPHGFCTGGLNPD